MIEDWRFVPFDRWLQNACDRTVNIKARPVNANGRLEVQGTLQWWDAVDPSNPARSHYVLTIDGVTIDTRQWFITNWATVVES